MCSSNQEKNMNTFLFKKKEAMQKKDNTNKSYDKYI